jgi:hypothetical protein
MLNWLFGLFSGDKLRSAIKEREAHGYTGATDSTQHALNCAQTDRLSDQGVQGLIVERAGQGKPVAKLVAAAVDRGIPIPTASLSDATLGNIIKEREAHGYTGATDSTQHALNCAQTDRLSTGQIDSLIESRRAAGLPTGKLEAARRNRG